MKDFAAIDFETANNERTSVCSVGVIIVRNGEIVDSFYSLIQPEPNYYNYWCTQVHGLTEEDTEDAPIFPEVWKQIVPLIEGLPLVAHNKAVRRELSSCRFPLLPDGLSRISFPLHTHDIAESVPRSGEPPVAYCGTGMWICVREPSPCTGRCRSMCGNSNKNSLIAHGRDSHQ